VSDPHKGESGPPTRGGQPRERGSRGGRGSSEGRGRPRGVARLLPKSGTGWAVVVIVLLLAGNLLAALLGAFSKENLGRYWSSNLFWTLATWVPLCLAYTFGVLGAFWATMGARVRRRRGLPLYKWVFGLGLFGTFGLTLAAFEPVTFPRERLVPVAFLVIAVQTTLTALALKYDLRIRPSGRREEEN